MPPPTDNDVPALANAPMSGSFPLPLQTHSTVSNNGNERDTVTLNTDHQDDSSNTIGKEAEDLNTEKQNTHTAMLSKEIDEELEKRLCELITQDMDEADEVEDMIHHVNHEYAVLARSISRLQSAPRQYRPMASRFIKEKQKQLKHYKKQVQGRVHKLEIYRQKLGQIILYRKRYGL